MPATGWGVRALLAPAAAAWSREGFDRINSLASGLLTGRRKEQAEAFLGQKMDELAPWQEAMDAQYAGTRVMRWHTQVPEWTCQSLRPVRNGGNSTDIRCDLVAGGASSMFCAFAYFFDHFTHEALLEQYPLPKTAVTFPKSLPAFDGVPSKEGVTAEHLRWLVTLIAEMHQPLHLIRGDYDYGRNLNIVWNGETYGLVEFWEQYLPSHAEPMPPPAKVAHIFQERAMSWSYLTPLELFMNWAKVSAQSACSIIYEPLQGLGTDGQGAIILTADVYKRWLDHVDTYSQLAAQRIVFVLQDLLEHKEHREAHKQGRGRTHRHSPWRRHGSVNVLLAAITVPAFLVLMRCFDDPHRWLPGWVFAKASTRQL